MTVPRWLGRLVYALRGRRYVRLHTCSPNETSEKTFEGLLVGRWCGHYILEHPKLLQTEEGGTSLPDSVLEIPVERVWLVEVLVRSART